MSRVLVVGFGASGEAVARRLLERGDDVAVMDDRPTTELERRARELGLPLAAAPDPASFDLVVPSPGVPCAHPVLAAAADAGVPVWSEVELGASWASQPLVAVTGTDGKTTVTTLVTSMLVASGIDAVAAGNIGLPLCDAAMGAGGAAGADVLVVEASSFALHFTEHFHPRVATWLNLADDHRDWHPSPDHYRDAKARIFANQDSSDTAVVNADDAVVVAEAKGGRARVTTFGTSGDASEHDGVLTVHGIEVVAAAEMPRSLPHDVSNALAASATALAAGASLDGVRAALRSFEGLPHRVSFIGQAGAVRWYDDSKATTPHAVGAAVAGFDSVVLIAGGRNKGLDLTSLGATAGRVRAVVAIGDAAAEIEAAFSGRAEVRRAESMDAAVDAAAELARPGDAVLLSPGCASFDWYRSYGERGDDFARAVRERVLEVPGGN